MATSNLNHAEAFEAAHVLSKTTTVTMNDAVLVRFPAHPDPTQLQRLRLIEESGVLNFWNEEENAYELTDGEPT